MTTAKERYLREGASDADTYSPTHLWNKHHECQADAVRERQIIQIAQILACLFKAQTLGLHL